MFNYIKSLFYKSCVKCNSVNNLLCIHGDHYICHDCRLQILDTIDRIYAGEIGIISCPKKDCKRNNILIEILRNAIPS
jgi:hypothetical protein